MTEITDEKILERAQEIKAERGGTLMDAMERAELELRPEPDLPAAFTVSIPVKPRIAAWVLREFHPTKDHTTEERLGAYLTQVLARVRVTATRAAREAPDIGEGSAVTLTRAQFQRKAPKE